MGGVRIGAIESLVRSLDFNKRTNSDELLFCDKDQNNQQYGTYCDPQGSTRQPVYFSNPRNYKCLRKRPHNIYCDDPNKSQN